MEAGTVPVISSLSLLSVAVLKGHSQISSSGSRVRLRCERTQVRISPRTIVFIAMATVICSLGYGLRLTAMPRSTQPCIPSGSLNRVSASAGVRAGMLPLPGGR